MAHTFVIAEIGSCHDGSLDKALALIRAAAYAGADCAKAQYWSSADRMAERRKAPNYRDIYAKYQVPKEWLPVLADECRQRGIEFACSTYLPEDVPIVAEHTKILKIASFEADDFELLFSARAYADVGYRVIVSSGLCAQQVTIQRTFGTLSACPVPDPEILHCVSAYPAPLDALGLERIRLDNRQGYSDHSGDIRVGGWAVAAGAGIIEAHLRLHETDDANPDAGPHSLTPGIFAAYVREIRDVEQAMSSAHIEEVEREMAQYKVR